MTKIKVLFVCLGNICRSPLAEAIFKHKVRAAGLESHFEIDSCGTANYHVDDSPDHRTIANAIRNGVTIDHKGRQLHVKDLEYYDYVIAMDASNHANILKLPNATSHAKKIKLMREWDNVGKGGEVPDPYYRDEAGFQEVFDILNRCMDILLDDLHPEKK